MALAGVAAIVSAVAILDFLMLPFYGWQHCLPARASLFDE
jgi:hypothetical protein